MIDPRSLLELAAILAAILLRETADALDRWTGTTTAGPAPAQPPPDDRCPDHVPDALTVTR